MTNHPSQSDPFLPVLRIYLLLALTGAILLLIPVVGAILAAIMPLLLGLLTGVPLSLLTAVYTLVVLSALKWWVEPRLSPTDGSALC